MPETDGCTLFPEGNWGHCCHAHDLAYWAGADRWASDLALGQCVFEATGSSLLSLTMTIGVGLFGWIFYRSNK